MAQLPTRPTVAPLPQKTPRELVREMADALSPLMRIGVAPWEHIEVPIGPDTSASIRFKGRVGRLEIEVLIKHLTLLCETLPAGDWAKPATADDIRSIMEDALNIKMREG
ncbi:hypothetical protein EZH22_24540 [Xanthobacter dioxanivorans]|uniref:Uncharacterized protein n=1 Tax=Xanthobacter dioxanivorans TaxID=2528964 RepID=A0A974PM31_9HYPH|nr:hypothetical protein [Xanthobacter dioxanivorans]QRG06122.1 hypothetical protein EZH22_24540 [Xanthobacter dioxanivorans]